MAVKFFKLLIILIVISIGAFLFINQRRSKFTAQDKTKLVENLYRHQTKFKSPYYSDVKNLFPHLDAVIHHGMFLELQNKDELSRDEIMNIV